MKIRIDERTYEGSGAEIMDRLREELLDPAEFPDTDSYIRFVQGNTIRVAGLDCPLPAKDTEARAIAMLRHLDRAGALTVLEDE